MHPFLFLFLLLGITTADKCGSNCLSGRCPSCPCGTTRRMLDPETWCSKFVGWNQACCRCIVSKESSGNANSMYYNGGGSGFDVGLWQINQRNWGFCNAGLAPCDPDANLECAKRLWRTGNKSFKRWATAKSCNC